MMPDFSEKYKSALEEEQISPDFIERTAAMMAQIRDGSASENETSGRKKVIRVNRWLSAAAAAAACVAVVIAVGRNGSTGSGISTVTVNDGFESNTAESLDITEELEVFDDDIADEDIAKDDTGLDVGGVDDSISEAGVEETQDETMPAVTEMTEAEEIAVTEPIPSPHPSVPETSPATAPAVTVPPAEVYAETTVAAPRITAAAETTAVSSAKYISGEEVYVPPVSEGYSLPVGNVYDEIVEQEAEAAAGGASEDHNDLILEEVPAPVTASSYTGQGDNGASLDGDGDIIEDSVDDTEIQLGGSGRIVKGKGFYAEDVFAGFDENSSVLITPTFEEYSEDSGRMISYKPVTPDSGATAELISSFKALTDGKDGTAVMASPGRSEYIIDLSDGQGNSLRVYTDKNSICFMLSESSGMAYYSFELTEEESAELFAQLYGSFYE